MHGSCRTGEYLDHVTSSEHVLKDVHELFVLKCYEWRRGLEDLRSSNYLLTDRLIESCRSEMV